MAHSCPSEGNNGLEHLFDKLGVYGREDIFKVLDWKEGSLYILDPLFLFYLRWGGAC